jgi:hypothetical protein
MHDPPVKTAGCPTVFQTGIGITRFKIVAVLEYEVGSEKPIFYYIQHGILSFAIEDGSREAFT